MSLFPENNTELLDDYLERESSGNAEQPSKTYAIRFTTGQIGGFIDELEAVKQYIRKAIVTERSKWRIYTDDFGCELYELIGQDVSDGYLSAEIPRMVREAVEYDDRILAVNDVTVRRDGDTVFITSDVSTIYGDVASEVVI